jgi:hypothetical protein
LKGEVREALDKGCLVTGNSLQGFVADQVPRILRVTVAGNVTQTPCVFGNYTKEFVIADVSKILAAKAAKASTLGSLMKESRFRGESGGRVRSLSGFKKGHKEPDGHFTAAENFLKRIGHEEVDSQAKEIHEALKAAFKYKFKDVQYGCYDGAATIKTPDFDVNIWIQQDSGDPSAYVITTDVTDIRRQAVIMEDEFSDVFSPYCDQIFIELSKPIDVGKRIEQIEEVDELAENLNYPAEGDSFTLKLPAEAVQFEVTANQITISLLGGGNLKTLLANSQKGFLKLGGAGVVLMLPQKTGP